MVGTTSRQPINNDLAKLFQFLVRQAIWLKKLFYGDYDNDRIFASAQPHADYQSLSDLVSLRAGKRTRLL
jgi:hypothetical protein